MPCLAYSLTTVTVGLNPTLISCENIRIYHDCLVWIENSVPRVTVRQKWCQTVIPRERVFIHTNLPNSHGRFFSLHTLSVFIAFCHFKCETFTNILTETQSIFCSCSYNFLINLFLRLQLHVYIIEELQFRRNNLAWSLYLYETISCWNFLIPSNNQHDLRMDLLYEAWVR